MTKEQIARINVLAKKKREEGLTPEEQEEQTLLREQYISEFRANLKSQLDSIYVEQEDGTYQKLTQKDECSKENYLS